MSVAAQNVEDVYELSPLQQGMLFNALNAPHSGMYFQQTTYTLQGSVDVRAFQEAWQQVLDRHTILRTSFHWDGLEKPLQVVHRRVEVPVEELDWRGFPPEEQERELKEYAVESRKRGFTLTQAPLLRLTLIRLGEETYQYIFAHHHLLWDGWSAPLILKEFLAAYESLRRGQQPPVRPVRPFRDYIAWLQKQDPTKAETFWRQTLHGVYSPTLVVQDRSGIGRNGKPDVAEDQRVELPGDLSAALQSLARKHGLTLNTVMQGAWAILLHRYSGQESVVFGTSVSGRPAGLPGVESMIGLFVNTLPVRIDVGDDQSLLPWLRNIQNQQAEQKLYEFSPLVQIQGWSDVPRGTPLFENMLIFENFKTDESVRQQVGSLGMKPVKQMVQKPDYPLVVVVMPKQPIHVRVIYATNRIESEAVTRILRHLRCVLESMVARPEQTLGEIDIMPGEERQQLVHDWNGTETPWPSDRCIHELVETQVDRRPDAVAVTFHGQDITYGELDRRANQLAHHLRQLGVGPESLVGLSVDRSPDLIIGILGILKAGGAYVPLDPALPAGRLQLILEDTMLRIVLTQSHLRELFAATGVTLCCLDTDWPTIASQPDTRPDPQAKPHYAAYLIYTSGSTGRPKGVVVEHRGLTNAMCVQVQTFDIRPTDRVLQCLSMNFDAAQGEIFRTLVGGATFCMATADETFPGRPFLDALRNLRITVASTSPTAWSAVPLGEELADLRVIITGGEPLPTELAAYWGKGRNLFNGYGPTEATVGATIARDWDPNAPPPIGKPIANVHVYVLDQRLRPVPIGVFGELHIGGVGVARGYFHLPELTAARFVPDPYSPLPGSRMYRTGDLGRWRPDGDLEFISRTDDQVKLRGFRIELGEIETVLGEHPEVLHSVVIVREDVPGDKRLVAYVVPQHEPGPNIADLRTHLKSRLPEYMVPAAFVLMRELPLTSNNKVDRRALPAPDTLAGDTGENFVPPRNPTEDMVAGIWSDVLKLDRVGAFDQFFELGGHSLMATQVMSRVKETFGVELPLRTLFEAGTVAGLSDQVEKARRQAALKADAPPLVSVSRTGDLPVSFAQQRLWFFDQLEPGNLFYNLPNAIRMTGALNVDALHRALQEIVRRHEVLRTSFGNREGQPVQIIDPAPEVPLPIIDISDVSGDQREARAKELATTETRKAFDLARGPLVRASLLRLAPEEHVLLVAMHHIITDGWSMGSVFFRELATLYRAFSNGEPSPLAELPIQYADFAAWQRHWLQGEVLERQLGYWRENLSGVSPLEFPTDRPRPPEQTFHGAHTALRLPADLSDALQALGRREGTTLFMTLLAAFQAVLARYTGQDDIAVGTPIAGRNHAEIENLIGFFVNTLVMRTDISGNPTFKELLARVRETCLGAYDHQDVPFEKLVEEVETERDMSRSPLFQVLFVHQNAPRGGLKLGDLTLSPQDMDRTITAKFDLTLSVTEGKEGMGMVVKYNTDLFDTETMRRFLDHFRVFLETVAADPTRPIAAVPLLPLEERQKLLVEWNVTATMFPLDTCIHGLIEKQIDQRPDAVALIFEQQSLTYRELNRRTNRLARQLIDLGVGPERTVALAVERSPEMIVGILGVLKAGGAYVPLDSSQPTERLAYMLNDAHIRVVLTQSHLADKLPLSGQKMLRLDEMDWNEPASNGDDNPQTGVGPRNLAYIIFTSGSTGQPKGVLVQHCELTNVICAQNREFDIRPESRVLQYVAIHFDAAQGEVFRALSAGATLVLARSEQLLPGPEMIQLLRETGITNATLPTSVMAVLPDADLPGLKQITVGGEACPAERAAYWSRGRRFFNGYGPTETAICATLATGWEPNQNPPIGRPIANDRAYVLDSYLQPAPIGVAGELYIGGVGVTRGYLNRPDVTATAFLPDPYTDQPGARMYRTGDRVRWLRGGQLDFLGRADGQVKIRGFRVELGEIEAVLRQHGTLKDCHVMARESTPGQKRLVAYVVAQQDPAPTAGELRDFVKSKLPDYMTPAAFVFMETLPRYVNGKINWRALPAPVVSRDDMGREFTPPRNAAEEVVTGIWSELLHVSDVSVHDDFFELGGHSLLATQVVSRLRSTFEVEVPLRAFFKDPTVAGLAENVERIRRAAQGIPAPPLVKVARDGRLPTSFAQQRLWFFDQMEPGNLFYNLPNAIRLHGNLDESALRRAITEIVRRHESLRTTFVKCDGEASQVIAPPSDVTMGVIDISDLPKTQREDRTRDLATEDTRTPFDLVNGPLFRVTLIRLAPTEHVLLATMHHIITDGWSMGGVFFRELAALYRAFAAGEPSPLPELAIQYADFAAWQRGWLQGEVLDHQLTYWREKLADTPPLELPTDRPRLAEPQFRGNFQSIVLSADFAAQLQQLSRKEGVTLFMTLLAAFQSLLSRYSGQDDIAVGTPVAGRNRAEIETLIGFFVNTLVMRTDLAGDPTFKDLLGRVRETCLGAYDHQDIPFEKLVEELHPQRDLSRSPLFQVMFVLQNAPRSSMSLGDLTISRQEADRNITSRYDLTLSVTESERGLGVVVKYKRDLFDDATMQRFLKHFQTLLEDIVANPERRLSELTLLNAEERQQVVVDWNQTTAEYPRERCIHDLFEERVRETPDAIAAIFSGQSLTYAELDRRANQLAHHLQGLGVGLENVVALSMDRSLDVVIGILGVLKTGAAYLPLDPAQPAERTEFILQDAGVRFLLTHSPVNAQANSARVISIDRDWGIVERHPVTAPRRQSGPDNLAYVIYTSGSTGKPKGVLVPHRGLMNVVTAQNRAFEIGPESRVLQWVPINFDASQGEVFRALTAGATLCLAPASDLMPGEPLRNTMLTLRITAATTHPSAPSAIANADLPDLCSLSVGGDQCPIDLAKRWAAGRKLFNGYGPTETTICATLATGWDPERTPPIGRPIGNTQVYVLDSHLRPAPVGVPGELHIGGDGVARGYLHLPELTATSFVPDPFGDRPGARLYRTGDRVRWLGDGQLEFMGRVDGQVKIRGFRIELGEIENVLKQHTAIRECAVAAREDAPGDKQLVAYVVTSNESAPATDELRSFLKAKLPEYMVPAAFVYLDAIPRKAHGKVDRGKLTAPEPARRAEPVAPRDAVELQLVQIWEEVLTQRPIGVRDNFFELGGHSLLAVKLMDRMKSTFDKKLSMAVLFRHPTIEDLADKLRQQTESDSPLVEIRPQGNQRPLFLIHPAEGNVLCYANLVRHLDSDLPIYGLQARGLTGEQEPHTTVEEMAAEYLGLIRDVQPKGPYRLGGWSTGGLVAYEMAQQLARQGESVELVAMFDTHVPRPDRQRPDIDPSKRMQEFAKERGFELPADFATIPSAEQLNVFLEHARAANALPPGLGEEQIQRLQRRSSRVFQANMDAVQKYAPQPYSAPLLFVQATERPDADTSDEDWRQLMPAVTVHQVPGSHESMIKEPHVETLAEVLLARIRDNSSLV